MSASWKIKTLPQPVSEDHIRRLAAELQVSPITVRLLLLRGVETPEAMHRFLCPGLRYLLPLEYWPGVLDAAKIIARAVAEGKGIAIWGDYDVDGITATVLAKEFLSRYGARVLHVIPDRRDHGYGLAETGIRRLAEENIAVLLTVDCGVANGPEIALARSLGMEVVVADHHVPGKDLPPATALINPKLGNWPSEDLSGVALSFLLMAAAGKFLPRQDMDIRQSLDLVALGTIADVIPLDEQNRILVKNGMLLISEARRVGIHALKEASGIHHTEQIGVGAIGYALAPRINAAGRVGDPSLAVELLLAQDLRHARQLALELDALNAHRKETERSILAEALAQAESQREMAGLVLYGEHWHPGVIGIVASRIVERYGRPCIILTQENGLLKGSARSVPNFDLYQGLAECRQWLTTFGGHKQAAGLKLEEQALPSLRQAFAEAVQRQCGAQLGAPAPLLVDMEVAFAQVHARFLHELDLLQPFGPSNPRPIFLSPPVTVTRQRFFGMGKHVELWLRDTTDGVSLRGVAWRLGETWKAMASTSPIRVAYTPKAASFRGTVGIELTISGIFSHQSPP
ncbi:single-stranded-DNA-specific exonuclease RecJ [Thermodesulfomicrobium sp. WS]|uniref:single-stranded-DNA-specific exonuclease RecJ n=1 Tax=Thermodesulfomicrobium sp. WS TaxID=3004129 RepID=UPI0024926AF7|nr:single-stranded-DNA-specific exonuclease RecJ [Thermodesulfomicrobium sp. WS]BDV00059.1 single-stranded-DNA-specific exonuclease RecJ [Thermodesulfomicrobium sp. WS]